MSPAQLHRVNKPTGSLTPAKSGREFHEIGKEERTRKISESALGFNSKG